MKVCDGPGGEGDHEGLVLAHRVGHYEPLLKQGEILGSLLYVFYMFYIYMYFFGLILKLLIFQFQGALLLSNGNSILCSVELQISQKLDILSCKHRYLCLRVTAQLLFKVTRLGLNAIRFVLKVTINLKNQ